MPVATRTLVRVPPTPKAQTRQSSASSSRSPPVELEPDVEDVHIRFVDADATWRIVTQIPRNACAWRISNLDGTLEARWADRDSAPATGRGAYSSLPARSYDVPLRRPEDLFVLAPSGSPAIEVDVCFCGCLRSSRGQRGAI